MRFLQGSCSFVSRALVAMDTRRRLRPLLLSALLPVCACAAFFASQSENEPQDTLRVHYEAAGRYERAGDHEHAAAEYTAFLAAALHRIANGEAVVGRFEDAMPLFDEALRLAPRDNSLRLDYARVCLDAEKLAQAKTLAQDAVRSNPKDAQARFLLGGVLFHLEDYSAAKVQLEAAVAANSDFKTGYLLGRTYLILHEEPLARRLFDEMAAGLGDTALIHIYFGRAYSLMDYPDQAVAEFKKAIARDGHAVDAHYYLALAYLRHDESAGYGKAIPEFQAEIKVNPNDVRSHYMLGYIALKQNRFAGAESELSQAAALQPQDLNTLLNLAEAYIGENDLKDAEATLRKAIQIAGNGPAKQQTGRAHYLLGPTAREDGPRTGSKTGDGDFCAAGRYARNELGTCGGSESDQLQQPGAAGAARSFGDSGEFLARRTEESRRNEEPAQSAGGRGIQRPGRARGRKTTVLYGAAFVRESFCVGSPTRGLGSESGDGRVLCEGIRQGRATVGAISCKPSG